MGFSSHPPPSSLFFYLLSTLLLLGVAAAGAPTVTSILITTLGRSSYNFDIFSTPLSISTPQETILISTHDELQLTDGISVNYNGFFPPNSSSLLYVSECDGSPGIYLDLLLAPSNRRREALELSSNLKMPLIRNSNQEGGEKVLSMKDRPSISGDMLVYVSTEEPSPFPRHSWAAVYYTHLATGDTRRLTPYGIADFSPAVSPSGLWTAVASAGSRGWSGEIEELHTGIFLFKTKDGSSRSLVVGYGGWPCWGDDGTLYFHRRSSDGWWSVYRVVIRFDGSVPVASSVERVTRAGFHAFTPAASPGVPGIIAVATRRPEDNYRHIEIVDMRGGRNAYVEVTKPISPNSHHYNPFISPDGTKIGYHRCRGYHDDGNSPLLFESIDSPAPETFSLLRIAGSFPSFSPNGDQIAYAGLPGLYVVNSVGSGEPREILNGMAFSTAWDWKRKGVIYTSYGPTFAAESTQVDVISVTLNDNVENSQPSIKKLTTGGENNAFPSPSPDGKWVVFRSGRSGHKNIYIMDAVDGEAAGIHQLTKGPWTDTMCNWSPDGEWIAFASDRDNPGSGSFAIYMVHPNGTGLKKVMHSGDGGRANHPWFSPDSKKIVFTSDYAAVSAEPIANPHHYQPYGDIFTMNIDGSDIRRLTHNSYEDGTPTWGPIFMNADVSEALSGSARCRFDDCHWLSSQNNVQKELQGSSC